MEGAITVVIVLSIVGVIAFIIHYFSAKNVIIRTLSKIPNKPSSSIKTNELSKVTGKALHVKDPLIAPYSNRKCVFYQIIIEQKVSSGKSSHWKTLVKDEKSQEFFIETKNDFVIVNPTHYNINYICHLVKDKEQGSGTFNDPTQQLQRVFNRYGIEAETFLGFNKRLRYKEGIIAIGEEVTVAGIAKWKTLSEPIPEYPYSKIVSLESTDKQKLIITDLPEVRRKKL